MTVEIAEDGTAESEWQSWLGSRDWPALDAVEPGRRVVVVAAHPDDEVLGVAGLLSRLARHHPIVVVWATDGEASHPHSTAVAPSELARIRRAESRRALTRLGIAPVSARHLGLPDSGLADREHDLRRELERLVTPYDIVIAPWAHDGHPDHEAAGRAARSLGTTCWEYPIWAWHWAGPDDPRVPWQSLRLVPGVDTERKAAAICEFASQVQPLGPDPADAPILPPQVLAHFTRPFEVVFG